MFGRNYRRGYSTWNYHVTGGHEAEAKRAEQARKPTRIGLFVLRLLGYKGPVVPREPDIDRPTAKQAHPRRRPE